MKISRKSIPTLLVVTLASTLALGLGACTKNQTQSDVNTPSADADDPSDQGEFKNLCEAYTSCNACIQGQMQTEGKTEGEAETQCGLAVTGCWATWDKPVVCGDQTYDEPPS